ncbi:DUF4403 family protein [Limnovirga soli]|uniref:DUF4403 family protein n=1 Tax=Limnovirga soli TaxID=2656915 RepID=A0A8J8JQR8_9BACT|nr:DUF4403 family protein [Limnovirga soli]
MILSNAISFPDLQFDAKTNSLLFNLAKWILNSKITQILREKSCFNFSDKVEKFKQDVTTKLNEPLVWRDEN